MKNHYIGVHKLLAFCFVQTLFIKQRDVFTIPDDWNSVYENV